MRIVLKQVSPLSEDSGQHRSLETWNVACLWMKLDADSQLLKVTSQHPTRIKYRDHRETV